MLLDDKGRINLRSLTREERAELRTNALKLFEKGFGYKSVGSILRISIYTARDWMHEFKAGIFDPNECYERKTGHIKSIAQVKEAILKEHREGASYTQLMRKYGICKSTLRLWSKDE
ncbi:MAG: hypothetical protein IJ022_01170 [Burkholderiaceae bacterium]|nr:hypothetical protein [Burkholderiaceae bacterium]